MRRVTCRLGNLFGGVDAVRVRCNGTCRVILHCINGPKQLRLDGGVDYAHTKRNDANLERERQEAAEGKASK